jgi:hypothetical protein
LRKSGARVSSVVEMGMNVTTMSGARFKGVMPGFGAHRSRYRQTPDSRSFCPSRKSRIASVRSIRNPRLTLSMIAASGFRLIAMAPAISVAASASTSGLESPIRFMAAATSRPLARATLASDAPRRPRLRGQSWEPIHRRNAQSTVMNGAARMKSLGAGRICLSAKAASPRLMESP